MKRILALFLLLLMSAACAESAPRPYAIESGFLIFPAEDGKQPVPIAVKDGFAAKAQELAAENAYLGTPMNLPEALLPYVSDELDRKSTRLNSSHSRKSRMPSSA